MSQLLLPEHTIDIKQEVKLEVPRLILTGLCIGLAFGLIVSIVLTKTNEQVSNELFEQTKEVSLNLGNTVFDEIVSVTNAQRNLVSLTTSKATIKDILKDGFDKLNQSELASSLQPKELASSSLTPTLKPSQKKTSVVTTTTKYKDGIGPIEIRYATLSQIDSLPRIGSEVATKIYDFIQKRNSIKSFDEFLSIDGVGPKTVEKLRSSFHIK